MRESGRERPSNSMTLPRRFFVSEEIFAEESERLFRSGWFCVGRREQLARPGDYFLADVAGEKLIVTLDSEGEPQALFNVCRHRGTRLATERSGEFTHCRIRCPYHRWTYDCNGRLLAAPNMDGRSQFALADWPLHKAAIADWQGFLFVNLAHDPQQITAAFSSFWDHLNPWRTADLRVAHRENYELDTNWKMVFENFNECYHCLSVHPGLNELSPVDQCTNDFSEGPFLGGPMQLAAESMTTTGRRTAPAIRTLDEQRQQRVYYFTLLPNMMFAMHPDCVLTWRLQPQGPGQTRIVTEWLYEPETIETPGFDAGPAIEFWDQTNRQDWAICQSSYAGVSSTAYRPGPWSPSESVPRAFDRSVLTALGYEPLSHPETSSEE